MYYLAELEASFSVSTGSSEWSKHYSIETVISAKILRSIATYKLDALQREAAQLLPKH